MQRATQDAFQKAYAQLNTAQRQAVNTIEGPVMVIAGPGTGKTEVLALRIAYILANTDTQADGILCLTFTNSGVRAMRERLRSYIGSAASRVQIATFHGFGMKIIEEFYGDLGLVEQPQLIDDQQSVALCDEILHAHPWTHIRTRANPAMYFKDIKSLISLLKRERLTPELFDAAIVEDIEFLKNDDSSISTRGASQGQLKQEVAKKIESLERTREIVQFYQLYEEAKAKRNFFDYDDVLENLVKLVEISENAADTIRERFLYVLVDEHQDSSGVQNEFLAGVWAEAETQNIFVVGDDRQLIYGFGGASLSYFEGFKKTFRDVVVITLTGNYRSTQKILDTADALLKSSLADAPLVSNKDGEHPLRIIEAQYPRDEIIRAGIEIKKGIEKGTDPSQFAILVPKNAQVASAIRVLRDLGIPVSAGNNAKLFAAHDTQSFMLLLKTLAHPMEPHLVARTLFDPIAHIPPLAAHQFVAGHDSRKLTLTVLLENNQTLGLYPAEDSVALWARQLSGWLSQTQTTDIQRLVQIIGTEALIDKAQEHDILVRRIEIVRTFVQLADAYLERNSRATLAEFVEFLERLEEYGTDIPIAVFGAESGVQVMTLHGSKGLQFDYVWIAHMDQRSVMGSAGGAFTLPASVKERMEEHDEAVVRRQVYVAITRAQRFCTISYAASSAHGGTQELAHVISDLDQSLFDHESATDTEAYIHQYDPKIYVTAQPQQQHSVTIPQLVEMVAKEYDDKRVSVTLLNNFFSCPWKWYFRSLLQLPEPQTVSLEFGDVVHKSIERILKQKTKPTDSDISAIVSELAEKKKGIITNTMRNDAVTIVRDWVHNRMEHVAPKYECEYPLSYTDPEFEHLRLFGKIDLMEYLPDNNRRVTDFKTGKTKTSREIEKLDDENHMSDMMRQLAMYSYLLQGMSKGDAIISESRLEFLEDTSKKGIYSTVISQDTIERLRDDIKEYDRQVQTGAWVNRPCNFKPFKTGDTCPYCKLAQIYGVVSGA